MSIERVDSASDDRLADYRDLTDVALRRVLEPEGGLYIAESAKVIKRALAAGHRPCFVCRREAAESFRAAWSWYKQSMRPPDLAYDGPTEAA